jgi:methionine-rich copper-binding protein CopC
VTRPSLAAARRSIDPARPSRSWRLRRTVLAAAAGVVLLVAPVGLAGPAAAHDELTGSNPSDGSTVTEAPQRVRLNFSAEVKQIGLTVLVKDPSGASVASGEPTIDGTAVIQRLEPLTESGVYTVAYRVVSSDGHPISGRVTFTADLPTPSATPTASTTASATPTPTASEASPAAAGAGTPSPSESVVAASPAAAATDAGGAGTWVLVGAGLLVALVVAGLVLARRRSA